MTEASAHGFRALPPLALAVAMGDVVAMTLSLAGVAVIFDWPLVLLGFKLVGVVILFVLGLRALAVSKGAAPKKVPVTSAASLAVFSMTALHPVGYFFFIGFMPQFISQGSAFLPQAILLEGTFFVLAAGHVFAWGALGLFAHARLSPGSLVIARKASGVLFLLLGGLALVSAVTGAGVTGSR